MTADAYAWIRTTAELEALAASLKGAPAVALDTESDNFYHYFDKVCLVQLAVPEGRSWLVDPLALPDLRALNEVFADAGTVKVIHHAENDVALLKRDFGFAFASIFDTSVAARLCGRPELGLDTLLDRELGIHHSKKHQRCDWSRRPLSREQEIYASQDVLHLFKLRERLTLGLRELGREAWCLEEGAALADLAPAPKKEPADFFRAKGAHELAPRDLAVLRELFALREQWARAVDRPLFKIIGDEVLVAMAAQRPRNKQELGQLRGMPAFIRERRGPEMLEAIRRGEECPEAALPRRERVARPRWPLEACRRVDRLKVWRAEAGPRANLEAGVLLPQRLIDRIALDAPHDLATLAAVPGIRQWRVDAFGPEILEALKVQAKLPPREPRLANPAAEPPAVPPM